ncbi:MAG: secretin N-terminal domain-containing protein [Candidatus Omnitrophota bacterium]
MKKKIIFLGVLLTFFIAVNGDLYSRAEDVTGGSLLTEAPAIDTEKSADVVQPEPLADAQAEPEIVASKEEPKYDMMSERISPGNITVDFKEADIRTVLRILSEKSGVNIVASKDVEGTITIRLNNVYWEKALDIICKNYSCAFERDGNIIRVTTVENLKQEELTTEVFSLNYANAEDVAGAVAEMLSLRGKDKVRFDERTNVLIVTDIPTNLYKIRQVVDKLDKRTPQVLIEAKIIETTLIDTENLGIDWTVKLSAYGAKRPITFPFTVSGTLSYLGIPKDMWNTFMPRVEGDTTYDIQDATGGAPATITATTESPFPIELGEFRQWSDSPFPVTGADQFTFGTLDFSQFSLVLEYLKSRRDTNVLSNPRIATLNNQEATILVGTILAIPKFERNPDTGTMEVTGYTEKDLGIKLNVIPHINASGDIVVDLRPEISALLGFDTLDAARGLVAPRYSTREATTQIMVRDGETIMIGGLINENTVNLKKKVPWLGDIPVLGRALFTKTEESIQKTELIIFMTVHLINNDAEDFGMVPSSTFVPMSAKKQ